MPKGTPLTQLDIHPGTINLLTRAGIKTVEQLGRTHVSKLKTVHGLGKSRFPEIFTAYSKWFAENICAPVPPLPDNWKPFQWGEDA